MGITISLVTSLLFGYSLIHFIRLLHASRPSSPLKSVAIVVLGDVARSPRTCRHAVSFLERGWTVHLVGYFGTPLPEELSRNTHLKKHDISPPGFFASSIPASAPKPIFLLLAALKIVWTTVWLLWVLIKHIEPLPGWVLVQNPPAIPTLPVVQLFCFACHVRLIIDWHNTGCSILALRLGSEHPIVRLATWLEAVCGRDAAAHLFVSEAEKQALMKDWKLRGRVVVFYDRPPRAWRRLKEEEMHELWLRVLPKMAASDPGFKTFLATTFTPSAPPPHSTPFTQYTKPPSSTTGYVDPIPVPPAPTSPHLGDGGQQLLVPSRPPVRMRSDRPAIVVSSTSWTADEDFGMLIEALSLYVKTSSADSSARSDQPRVESSSSLASSTAVDAEGFSSGEEVEAPGAAKTSPDDVDDWVDAGKPDTSLPASPRAPVKPIVEVEGAKEDGPLPDLVCFITGKGPLRDQHKAMIEERSRSEGWATGASTTNGSSERRPRVFVHLVWLEASDYPRLLGCADVGVSLHVSSSGFDLPMKVVDCFGCGTPVCARGFPSAGELVKQDKNGYLFDTAQELADELKELLRDFREFPSRLDLLRAGITSTKYGVEATGPFERPLGWETWEDEWERLISPIVTP